MGERIQGSWGERGRRHPRHQLVANATLDGAFLQAAPWDAVVGLTAALTPQRTQVDQGGCWTCEVAWGSGELES